MSLGRGPWRKAIINASKAIPIGVMPANAKPTGELGLTPLAIATARDELPGPRARSTAAALSITTAAGLGLGYPLGPLAMGDRWGPSNILEVLFNMQTVYGDPRYRPSPWLKRRALLGVSLTTVP